MLIFFLSFNVRTSLCTSYTTIEDVRNVEIAKSMWAGDQRQKYMYDLEWPKNAVNLLLAPVDTLGTPQLSSETTDQTRTFAGIEFGLLYNCRKSRYLII